MKAPRRLRSLGGTEGQTGARYDDSGELTVVKVEVEKEWDAPQNDSPNRHQFGVSEPFTVRRTPNLSGMHWRLKEGITNSMGDVAEVTLKSPLLPMDNPVKLEVGSEEYTPTMSIVEPDSIVVGDIFVDRNAYVKGEAGACMELHLYVHPLFVSFKGLSVMEIPCDQGILNGYFADVFPSRQSHTADWGAGRWFGVSEGNHVGEPGDVDHVNSTLCPKPFYGGTMQWDIPIGWKPKTWNPSAQYYRQFTTIYSLFNTITDQGTVSVRKFNHTLVRTTNDVYVLDGELLK